jgi:hypothetical protein
MEKIVTNDIVLTKKFKKFLHSIIEEHYNMTSQDNDTTGSNQSLNYLWYMYHKGVNAGTYRPFIFMAEMHLLKEMGYMENDDIKNLNEMIKSEDKDNFYLGYLSLESLRNKRIKEHGTFSQGSKVYMNLVPDYASKILNTTLFQNALKS